MTIGENIKKARVNAGIKQSELGKMLGITAATVSAFETNKTNIKQSTIERIAAALDVDAEELCADMRSPNVKVVFSQQVWDVFKELATMELVMMFDILTAYIELGDVDITPYPKTIQLIWREMVLPDIEKYNAEV